MNRSSLKLQRTGKITLLLTILCASALYSMEVENDTNINQESMDVENTTGSLPKELQDHIAQIAIASSTTFDEAITTIKNLSIVFDKLFNNLDDFTKLVLTLADRFKIYPYEVAQTLNTPIAKEYMASCSLLCKYVQLSDNEKGLEILLKPLLAEHPGIAKVDPQILFTSLEVGKNTIQVIKLLLDNGANPYGRNDIDRTFIEYVNFRIELEQRYPTGSQFWTQVKALVKEAIAKQSAVAK